MDYQIKYELTGEAKRITAGKVWLKYVGFGLLVIGLCAAVLWSAGGDWTVTVGALEGMAKDMEQGSDFREAFSSFCLEVLQGAECG